MPSRMPSKSPTKQKLRLNDSGSPKVYPDLDDVKDAHGMSDGDGSFIKYRNGSNYEGKPEDEDSDSDYQPNKSVNDNSLSSSYGDSGQDIPMEELEELEKDRAKPPIDVHGRGSIHVNESPAWTHKLRSGRGKRPKEMIVDRGAPLVEQHQWSDSMSLINPGTGRRLETGYQHLHRRKGETRTCMKNTSYLSQVSDDSGSFPCPEETMTDKMMTPNVLQFIKQMLIILVVIGIVAIWMSGLISSPVSQGSARRPNFLQLKYGVQRIRETFEKQESRLWNSLLSAALPSFDELPLKPGVAVIAYSGSDVTTRCLTTSFAEEFSQVFQTKEPLMITDGLITKSKRALDLTLREGFGSGVKVVVFPHLEKFDRDTLLLMHDFCDDQYAPFKDVLLVFLTRVPEDVEKKRIEDYLSDLFRREVGEDEAGALISRVVRNVAKVKDEDPAALREFGCPV